MRRLFLLWAFMPVLALPQSLDSLHIMIDAEATVPASFIYNTFQDAAAHFRDNMTVYINPGVYWIDDPDDATVRIGKNGREPFGMVVKYNNLHFIGKGECPEDVVLASQRGQTQGAIGNFTMFDFWCNQLEVENLTMGNYCNVDLVYPKNPRFNRKKRSDAITQAHVGYMHGDTLIAKRVRFISRLNLNPLNGAKHSYYEDCHFECTDDALNGNAVYRRCNFDLYGQKPFWSTFGKGVLLVDCDFNVKGDNHEMYFCKQGGPVTLIDCRYHALSDSIYIGWTAYPQPWLRCYQKNFTLNGKPYLIGSRQPQNTLQPDYLDWVKDELTEPPFLGISQHEATLLTGRDTLRLSCSEHSEPIHWYPSNAPTHGYQGYVLLQPDNHGNLTVIPANYSDETADFCIIARTMNDREAACHLVVKPSILPVPEFVKKPRIVQRGHQLILDYALDLQGRRDESLITWYRDGIPVATSHVGPERIMQVSQTDYKHEIKAVIKAKHQRSDYGEPLAVQTKVKRAPQRDMLDTDFSQFYCDWQPIVTEGVWTVDGFKPTDTSEYDWSFSRQKPMWEYGEGFNGAVGMGLLQAQRGARLMYTPIQRTYGDMSLTLDVDPTKTAGQGFGSATGQYMDVCLKFDTQTLTGYGLRIIRTTKHAKAVDFYLVRYDHGQITSLTEPVSSTCYRTNCTISLHFNGGLFSADVTTTTPQPANSDLPHEVHLRANVGTNTFGGIHIQHTGSCGESTTMLHHMKAVWQ